METDFPLALRFSLLFYITFAGLVTAWDLTHPRITFHRIAVVATTLPRSL